MFLNIVDTPATLMLWSICELWYVLVPVACMTESAAAQFTQDVQTL